MSSNISHAALFFDAPMVSFGVDSKFDQRDTLTFPSRSVVTGLIAAAMGIPRGDSVRLAELAELAVVSIVFPNAPGSIEEDYHTIGGGYPDSLKKQFSPSSAEGKSRGTVETHRYYLTGSRSAAIVSGKSEQIARIASAMRDPVWGGWIGRKCCIPATPVFQGVFQTEDEALKQLRTLAGLDDGEKPRVFRECSPTDPEAALYPDIPVDFDSREFAPRAVKEV